MVPNLELLKNQIEQGLVSYTEERQPGFYSRDLHEALRYALKPPAKRLRPLMVLVTAIACDHFSVSSSCKFATKSALAVELIHTYSLIHDDLPCMDDDDIRRGRPSLHRRFDEATAVLAGDALLADAFSLAASSTYNGAVLCRELAQTAGSYGLVAGQVEDLSQAQEKTFSTWLSINEAKTARLFAASAVAGALSVNASKEVIERARSFGHAFGIAFQMKDDLDDHSGLALFGDTAHLKELMNQQIERAQQKAYSFADPKLLMELLYLE